jgi:hypothetical protein
MTSKLAASRPSLSAKAKQFALSIARRLRQLSFRPQIAVMSIARTGRPTPPAILHVTHWKAGSQWLHAILIKCMPGRIVPPTFGAAQVLQQPVRQGMVYPTVYVTRQEFDQIRLPSRWGRFVIIRDLRDTLVSHYFSLKVSHPEISSAVTDFRTKLQSMGDEEGLIYSMDELIPVSAAIQESWVAAGEPIIKYEDLLINDVEILERILLDQCGMPITRRRLREAILSNRFERMTGGRSRGQEDVSAHQRKGVAGDWQNHFSDRIKREFKARYGQLLIVTGYERDLNW